MNIHMNVLRTDKNICIIDINDFFYRISNKAFHKYINNCETSVRTEEIQMFEVFRVFAVIEDN
jgi:hypothetical protein